MRKRVVLCIFVECRDVDVSEKKVPMRHRFDVFYERMHV